MRRTLALIVVSAALGAVFGLARPVLAGPGVLVKTDSQSVVPASDSPTFPTSPMAGSWFPVATTSSVAVSGTTAPITGLAASSCWRLMCSVDVFYRTGTGTPVAVTTDAPLPGKVIERACLASAGTAFAFITAGSTGTCYVSSVVQ